MSRKKQAVTAMTRTWTLAKRLAMLAILVAGMTVTVYAQNGGNNNNQGGNNNNQGGTGTHHAPEIALGAGISAIALAGGGLLLLADRLRAKKKTKS
jgi:hypothetical protein